MCKLNSVPYPCSAGSSSDGTHVLLLLLCGKFTGYVSCAYLYKGCLGSKETCLICQKHCILKSCNYENKAGNLIEILLIYLTVLCLQPIVVFHKPLTCRQCKHPMKPCLIILKTTTLVLNLALTHCMTPIRSILNFYSPLLRGRKLK